MGNLGVCQVLWGFVMFCHVLSESSGILSGGSSGTSPRTTPTVRTTRPNSSRPTAWRWWDRSLGVRWVRSVGDHGLVWWFGMMVGWTGLSFSMYTISIYILPYWTCKIWIFLPFFSSVSLIKSELAYQLCWWNLVLRSSLIFTPGISWFIGVTPWESHGVTKVLVFFPMVVGHLLKRSSAQAGWYNVKFDWTQRLRYKTTPQDNTSIFMVVVCDMMSTCSKWPLLLTMMAKSKPQ